MKLWLPKWLREERKPNDTELENTDRRLFLRGLTLTSAGLVVGVPSISVPKRSGPRGYIVINSPMSDESIERLKRALSAGAYSPICPIQNSQPLQIEPLNIEWLVNSWRQSS